MKAIVSGQAGSFATFAGATASLHRLLDSTVYEGDARLVPDAFPGTNDTRLIEVSSPKDAEIFVLRDHAINRALRFFLILFEPRETTEERREVAAEVSGFLQDKYIVEGVAKRLYSAPLPKSAVLELVWTAAEGLRQLEDFLTELVDHQPAITSCRVAFDEIAPGHFSEKWPRDAVLEQAIEAGWFRDLSRLIKSGGDIGFFALKMMTSRQIDCIRDVVAAWTRSFQSASSSTGQKRPELVYDENDDFDLDLDPLDGAAGYQAGEQAKAKIFKIIDLMKAGDVQGAKLEADRLVSSQTSSAYAAKSLCNLSQAAKRLQLWPLQLAWVQRAVELHPEDPITFGHLVDALIQQRRFVEAKNASEEVRARGNSHFADLAIARILRAQGNLSEARNLYVVARDTEPYHPDAIHSFGGAAGTLREMGSLNDALGEYDAALARFPGAPILLSGRAATLVGMGRLSEALRAYLDLEKSGEGINARNGKAAIYRQTGRLDEAASAFQDIAAKFPFDPISANGLADVFRLQGKLDAALAKYTDNQSRFPYTPYSYIGAALALRDKGQHREANAQLNRALELFPDDPDVISELAKSNAAQTATETLHRLDALIAQQPQMFFARVQRAEILRRLDRFPQALAAFEDILTLRPEYLPAVNGKASTLLIMGNVDAAQALLPIRRGMWPQSHDEWKSYLLQGLILSKSGHDTAAVDHLNAGLKRVPFDREARLMRATLASIHLGKMKPAAAVKAMPDGRADITGIVRLHALAFEQRVTLARQIYVSMEGVDDNLIELRDEIARRYKVVEGISKRDPKWILEQEQGYLIRAAA